MTYRNPTSPLTTSSAAASGTGLGRSLQRVLLPILLLGATNIAAGCFQQAGVPRVAIPPRMLPPAPAPRASGAALSPAAPPAPADQPASAAEPDADRGPAMQVLPGGHVPETPLPALAAGDEDAQPVVTAPVIRWVKNAQPTTLWSSAQPDAAQFTDLPAGSFLRLEGPAENGRLAIFYVGDGLLRLPGGAWVDAGAVEAVDAPAPGEVPAVDAYAREPLPTWVQAHRATSLWSGPDDKAVLLTDLPQWTFLRVAGVDGGVRLLVEYAGDYATRQPGIGWVDKSAVGPSGEPGRWVTNHRASALWSGTDDNATRFTDLPQWSKLRIVEDQPRNRDRLEVEFFGDGRTRQPGIAWVPRADIGPITPPVPLPTRPDQPSSNPGSAGRPIETHTFASENDFITTVGAAARHSRRSTGVPASVTVAQAILESDWGRSRLTRLGNNLFGIKALSGPGPAGVVSLATWEHVDDGDVVVQAPFKAYHTLEESIDDHGRFFTRNRRYADAMGVASDPRAFARAIQDDGYATDPSYAAKLIRLMDRYDLYRFDSE